MTSWSALKYAGYRGSDDFIDQESTLNYAECFKKFGNEIYKSNISPTNCGNFLNSVELLRILNFFNLSTADSFILGTVFMWLTIGILCLTFFLIRERGKLQYAIATAACVSPGVWLLLERGNYDELMFCLTVAAGFLISSRQRTLGALLLGFSVLLKFYTLPAFMFAVFLIERQKTRRFFLLASVPLSLYSLNLISKVEEFPYTLGASFGLKSLGLYFEFAIQSIANSSFVLPSFLIPIPGIALLIATTLIMRKYTVTPSLKIEDPKNLQRFTQLYNLLLIVFLSCYFAGMNSDYRIVYLSFLVGISSLIFYSNCYRTLLVISGLLALTLNIFPFGLHIIAVRAMQMSGDIFLSLYVASQIVYLLKINPINNSKKLRKIAEYF
jgi:hypothetical protein